MEINGQLEAQVALHREKSPWYPLNRRLEGRKGGLDALGKAKSIAPFRNPATIQPGAKSQYPLRYLTYWCRSSAWRDDFNGI